MTRWYFNLRYILAPLWHFDPTAFAFLHVIVVHLCIVQGKVEAEIELVTAEEADAKPVGEGRDAPEPLEKPK